MKGSFELADERAEAFQFEHGDFVRIMGSFRSRDDNLPSSPVDVDERVYEQIASEGIDKGWNNSSSQPLSLLDFIATLQAYAAVAPEATQAAIKFSAYEWSDGESADLSYEVGYWRDPTPEERAAREEANRKIAEREERNKQLAADKERQMYERLKAKFESD